MMKLIKSKKNLGLLIGIVCILGVSLGIPTNTKILFIQEVTGIVSDTFIIGKAQIQRDPNWLLFMLTTDKDAKLFGFVPKFIADFVWSDTFNQMLLAGNDPDQPLKMSFYDYQKAGKVVVFSTYSQNLSDEMRNHFASRLEGSDLQVQEFTFNGWKSYKINSKGNNQTLLFIPDLNISINFDDDSWDMIETLELEEKPTGINLIDEIKGAREKGIRSCFAHLWCNN